MKSFCHNGVLREQPSLCSSAILVDDGDLWRDGVFICREVLGSGALRVFIQCCSPCLPSALRMTLCYHFHFRCFRSSCFIVCFFVDRLKNPHAGTMVPELFYQWFLTLATQVAEQSFFLHGIFSLHHFSSCFSLPWFCSNKVVLELLYLRE